MDLRQLRYFVAAAQAGHMTRAAAELGIQQPPLSLQIKSLETQLGMPLFVRHPKGVALTDGGRQFLAEARRILADMEAMQQRMARVARGQLGQLAIAFTSSAAAHAFMPEALRACRSRFPDIELVLGEDNAAAITEAIAASKLHAGFLRVPVARPEGVVLETLLNEPTVVALPLDHPLALRPGKGKNKDKDMAIALHELDGENLILVRRPGAPGLYANLLALCAAQGVRPNVVAEVDRMMTNLNLVAAGGGISVVPASMQGAHPQAIVYRPLAAAAQLDAPLTLAYRAAECTGATATFVTLVREIAAGHAKAKRPGAMRAMRAVRASTPRAGA
ncbi:MAG: LysR family transcriptional regulator [Rhodoferax sp.]|nr:LysR family transcriptional regulator [Rhodoferax sp.]